jgi:UDP-N-acetylmuramoylalanine--D-glutamate ligase
LNLEAKKILVVGLGRTGLALARFLNQARAAVRVTDTAAKEKLGAQLEMMQALGIETELGPHRTESFEQADMIVVSPGVPHTIEPLVRARELRIPVIGEIELASRFIREPIVAVTGTNGKTTTTELIGSMLRNSGRSAFVGGNIGNPLINYVTAAECADVVVAEISSFQLDTIETFRPKISVLLNITADHLDRYPDFAAYAAAKMRIFENQQKEDLAVLNGSDHQVRLLTRAVKSRKLFYPGPLKDEEGATLKDRRIVLTPEITAAVGKHSQGPVALDASSAALAGRHNLENACAAALAALAAGAGIKGVQAALNRFQASAHRLEPVGDLNGVQYFNDSKATNVDAVARALECFSRPVLLIMGGRDKGGNFETLRAAVRQHVRMLIVMGEAAGIIASALGSEALTIAAGSMDEAVRKAHQAAAPGDIVLLSPGCASFDRYDSYIQRGEDFRKAVEKLK